MDFDVFISYSSRDKPTADAACAVLESEGVRCWIAPRDILPGVEYATAISRALTSCKALVLVFSTHANESPQIRREVERAVSRGVPIVPLRIEDVKPTDSMSYYVASVHWLDAFKPPLENHLQSLARTLKAILATLPASDEEGARAQEPPSRKTTAPLARAADTPPASRLGLWATLAAVVIAVGVAGVWTLMKPAALVSAPEPVRTPIASVEPIKTPVASPEPTKTVAATPEPSPTTDAPEPSTRPFIPPELPATPAAEPPRKVGDVFADCAHCPEMVVAPSGAFSMGASANELTQYPDQAAHEGPVHKVLFAKPFAIGRYAVTRGQFDEFVRETNRQVELGCWRFGDGLNIIFDPQMSYRNAGSPGDDYPAACVSPADAEAYARWLASKTQRPYRLPSEAEREYAARAGSTTTFWWGESISADQANYNSTYAYRGKTSGPYRDTSAAVKSFAPNPWGLYQVHGNVREITADCWHDNFKGAPTDGSAWLEANGGDCAKRVLRNGAWFNVADLSRSAARAWADIGVALHWNGVGFRVARSLD